MKQKQTHTTIPKPLNKAKKVLMYDGIVKNVPFILFISALAIIYIFLGHKNEKLLLTIAKKENNVKELEYEYKSAKSNLIFRSRPAELSKVAEPLGLSPTGEAPILLNDETNIVTKDSVLH